VGPFFGHTLSNFLDFDWEVYYGVSSTHSPGFGKVELEIVYSVGFLSWDWSKFEGRCRGKKG